MLIVSGSHDSSPTIFKNGCVAVPIFRASGALHNRTIFGAKSAWYEDTGRPLLPYGLEALTDPPHDRALLLTEGISDTLAVRAAFRGESYDVLGLPGASTWHRSWLLWLDPYALVYLLPDGDEAGDRLAAAVKADRPDLRVIEMPRGEDSRSILQHRGWYGIYELLEAADARAAELAWLERVGDAIRSSTSLEECRRLLLDGAVPGEVPRAA